MVDVGQKDGHFAPIFATKGTIVPNRDGSPFAALVRDVFYYETPTPEMFEFFDGIQRAAGEAIPLPIRVFANMDKWPEDGG